jgi:hypothetical protein
MKKKFGQFYRVKILPRQSLWFEKEDMSGEKRGYSSTDVDTYLPLSWRQYLSLKSW